MRHRANSIGSRLKSGTLAIIICLVAALPTTAMALPGYVGQFSDTYPTSASSGASCALCHGTTSGGRPWNAYGRDLLANGASGLGNAGDLGPVFAAVEALNSDAVAGDNNTEIVAGTQPGWCEPSVANCDNNVYNADGSNAGSGTPPEVDSLDDDTVTEPEPNIQLSDGSIDFGEVVIGETGMSSVIVSNTGNAELTLGAAISGPPFAIVNAPATSVTGGDSTTVLLRYSPQAEVDDIGSLTLDSNDPDSPQLVVDLFGSGVIDMPPADGTCPAGTAVFDPIPETIAAGQISVGLETVASGFVNPVLAISAPRDRKRLFVADQTGELWAVDLKSGEKSVFLDVSDRLVELGLFGINYDERGLLGAAFAPDYRRSGLLYTYESVPYSSAGPAADFSTMPPGSAPDHQSVVMEWRVPKPGKPTSVVDPASGREILRIDQPQFNHNGGTVVFGPDDLLYVTLGDGGGADDQGPGGTLVGHSEQGNGQDTSNILGTIIRIDPRGDNAPNGQYGVPEGNPFVSAYAFSQGLVGGMAGCEDGVCDEIYAYGFRNAWRASFDSHGGRALIAADVGQNDLEEVNVVEAGKNYGWRIKDGSFCFDANGEESGFVTDAEHEPPPEIIDPVAEYDHDEGISVTGGFVYRGKAIEQLRGHYVFGDWAPTFVDPEPGRLFYLAEKNIGNAGPGGSVEVLEMQLPAQPDGVGTKINGFGRDARGELYVVGSQTGLLIGNEGTVQKIVPLPRR